MWSYGRNPAPYVVGRVQLPLRHHKMTHIGKPHQCVVKFIYRVTDPISVNAEPMRGPSRGAHQRRRFDPRGRRCQRKRCQGSS